MKAIPELLILFAGLTWPAAAQSQIAVVASRSFERLLADFKFLAPLVGQEDWPKQLESFLKLTAEGKPLAGVDMKRPFGVYLNWPDQNADLAIFRIPAVGFIPVTDQHQFLELIKQFQCKVNKSARDTFRISLPGALPEMYFRFANRYAYAAFEPGSIQGNLPEPATFLPSAVSKSTLAFTLRSEQFPSDFGQAVQRFIDETLRPILKRIDEEAQITLGQLTESDPKYKELSALVHDFTTGGLPLALTKAVTGLIEETKEISWTIELDQIKNQLTMDLAVVPRPSKELCKFIQYVGSARSRFSYVNKESALGLVVHVPWPQGVAALPESALANVLELMRASDLKVRQAISKGLPILLATLPVDGFDFCLVVRYPKIGDEATLVMGLKVQNGRKLDHLLRDVLKDLPTLQKKEWAIQGNYDRHGDARIHKFKPPFGKKDAVAFLAFRHDVVFLGAGNDSLRAIKDALDGLGNTTPPPSPLLQFDVSRLLLLEFELFDKDKPFTAAAQKSLAGTDKERGRVRISLQGGNDLRLRVTLDQIVSR
jgi:hypothetical protein